jgi:hypothetical protein
MILEKITFVQMTSACVGVGAHEDGKGLFMNRSFKVVVTLMFLWRIVWLAYM